MDILFAFPHGTHERGRQLSMTLGAHAGSNWRVTAANLDEALASVEFADSIVLIHGQPTVHLHAFVDQAIEQAPLVPILVAGVPDHSELIVDYFVSGAHGCLLEGHDVDELLKALETIKLGDRYLPPPVQAALIGQYSKMSRQFERFDLVRNWGLDPLTDRENEVLELIEQGLTNREIADLLYLEVGTVKNHVHHILRKLNLRDRQAAANYYRQGLALASGGAAA
jgi:DNA-binding NarL/FixJ family response regulator